MEGLPVGTAIDLPRLRSFLQRRAPGGSPLSTARQEPDEPVFTEGLRDATVIGERVTATICNRDARPQDYDGIKTVPRPGHADYTAWARYGSIPAGGGAFSGRMTAPLCIAGGICLQLLEQQGITIRARAEQIAGETEPSAMEAAILAAKADGDSVGGVIACEITGLPVGLGEPMFYGLENLIAQAVFAIPAVKGIEFGSGFAGCALRGSENNDPFAMENGRIVTSGNHHGGILGGMASGMPVTFRVAVKPTPSILKPQSSVDLQTGKAVTLTIQGRHDPCIVPRAVPCVEAAAAIAAYDELRMMEVSHDT